ncbi:HesB/YadR/YfhF family protein [Alkalihalobacillus trypoxylicola]|uniref:Core domain-containing protein n=1 Tax=Alkalihalobacillus trypoxylicola TaxID=519424 RepID=A0A162F631_9BACI|nr:HesB/YadR/YfhF family protein [Alkalihalobacillus trypoxylicola]KYG34864.1 hypothetical protein AZF04_00590 [Alkalihalobacillus trypoxylicola]GAF66809.1 hypothetical protein BTS2_3713 [Bacillus sp. TS-2]
MNIQVTKPAVQWFKKEFDLKGEGEYIRFFARYGGCATIQKGFSLGVAIEEPSSAGSLVEIEGLKFFVEESDLWYFNDQHLNVKYSRKLDEIEFEYL